jgi:hypothetical protein
MRYAESLVCKMHIYLAKCIITYNMERIGKKKIIPRIGEKTIWKKAAVMRNLSIYSSSSLKKYGM